MDTHLKNVVAFNSLKASKLDVSTWNGGELNTAIKALKTKEDGAMPLKKSEKVLLWEAIKHRTPFMPEGETILNAQGATLTETNLSENDVGQPSMQDNKEYIEPVQV